MSEQNKFDSTYSAVLSIANNLIEQGKYDSTYSAVLSIYQNLTGDTTTSFDSVYSIVVNIAEGIESGEIDLGGGSDIELVSLNETVTYNGLHQFVPVDGVAYNQVDITVDIPNETLTQTITTNGTYDYAPSEGFFNGVSVTVDVPTGGGSEEQDFSPKIRFFDFDGNIVEQWTLDEAKTKSENDFPTLESIGFDSFDLNFDGWNTPLQDMHETTSDIAVGSMWKPSDGNSWIKVNIGPENLTTVLLIEVLGDSVIDWGDGTTDDADTINGYPQHTYTSAGEKWVKIIGDWNPMWGSTENMTEKYNNYPIRYYNNQITEIYLGRDTERYSFSYLKSLQHITFPNVQHTYTNQLSYFSFAYDGSLKNLYLPYGDGDMPTPSETSGLFSQCYNLEVLSWRGWSRSGEIGNYYFRGLSNLRYTTIYHKVNLIRKGAFYQCYSLQSVNIPDSVTSIGGYNTSLTGGVFTYCYSLQSVNIPDSVTSIGGYAFQSCYSLHSINIPDSVTSIGDCAFSNCYSLQSVTIPDGVTSLTDGAFQSCTALHSVNIPDSVTSIGLSAFKSCSSLQSVTIPDSVTSIGRYAFQSCYSLHSINIPDSVTSIGEEVFSGCKALQSVTIPDSVTLIGRYAFNSCSSLQSVTIPDSVTSIGYDAFSFCTALQSVTIPDSVTSIGGSAFQSCTALHSVNIPDSVTSIGDSVFKGCKHLTVDFSDNTQVPTLSSTNAFDSTAIILVPSALYDEWISATNWSSIAGQIRPV